MKITPPSPSQHPEYYQKYIDLVKDNDLALVLKSNFENTKKFLLSIPESKLEFRYDTGKWTIKEIVVHLMDAERIFTYRALRFARNDKTALPGFEENEYTPNSFANERSIQNLVDEFESLRNATLSFFKNLNEQQIDRSGTANNNSISVRSLGYCIAGHELHHVNIIKSRYLNVQ